MPTMAERIADALVPALEAAVAAVPNTAGALVQARPLALRQAGDPPLLIQVTAGPERVEPGCGGPEPAWFGHYPFRATVSYTKATGGLLEASSPYLPGVRGAVLRAMLDFRDLGVAELDGAEESPGLGESWDIPHLAGMNSLLAGVTYRTWEPR